MSRATVRAQIASYLTGAGVSFLNSVKPFPAKFTPEMEFYQGEDPGHSSGAICYIYFAGQREARIALGGAHNGRKAVEYEVVLDCFMRSMHKKSEDAGTDNETFLDALTTAIRADRNAGNANIIFQWGEGNVNGGTDISITSYYPRLLNGAGSATQTYSTVRLTVVEILNT
jgi:hypothetical protein